MESDTVRNWISSLSVMLLFSILKVKKPSTEFLTILPEIFIQEIYIRSLAGIYVFLKKKKFSKHF